VHTLLEISHLTATMSAAAALSRTISRRVGLTSEHAKMAAAFARRRPLQIAEVRVTADQTSGGDHLERPHSTIPKFGDGGGPVVFNSSSPSWRDHPTRALRRGLEDVCEGSTHWREKHAHDLDALRWLGANRAKQVEDGAETPARP